MRLREIGELCPKSLANAIEPSLFIDLILGGSQGVHRDGVER